MDALCRDYKAALGLLGGRSRLLPAQAHIFGDSYNVYAICNIAPGCGDANADKLDEAAALFYELTGGGAGTDVCYRAQLAYYQGRLEAARPLALEAFRLARQNGQGLIALCAAETLSGIAKHSHDCALWNLAVGYIAAVAEREYGADRASREQAITLRCIIDLSLGFLGSVPDWIRDGDFGAISAEWGYEMAEDSILCGTLPNAMIARIQYDSYRGKPVRALQTIDIMRGLYGMGDVILDAYLSFFRAGCFLRLGDIKRVKGALESAAEALAPDGLWLIASEFTPPFGELLLSAVAKADPDGAERVRELGEGYWGKLAPFREELLRAAYVGLTRRERQVSALIAEGMTNAQIAARLSISERTVKCHVTSILSKYSIMRRSQLSEAIRRTSDEALADWTI